MVKLKSMSFQNKQEQAFTLAEVLITLGIIGVVAALTLPSLINRTKNRELHTAFLKTYSELNQVAQKYYADMGETVTDTSFATQSNLADEIMTKYYKGSTKITSNGMGTDDGNGNFLAFYSIRTLSGKAYSGGANSLGKILHLFAIILLFIKLHQVHYLFLMTKQKQKLRTDLLYV